MEDTAQYRSFYLQTARDYLKKLQDSIHGLETDPNNGELVKTAHIAWHSLKSQSDFMGFKTLALMCHVFELYFAPISKNQKDLSGEVLPIIKDGVATLEQQLHHIEQNGVEQDLTTQVALFQGKLGVSL